MQTQVRIMERMNDEHFMREALAACRRGIGIGQSPFGACIVRAGQVLGTHHNHVWATSDPTAHAEVHTIRCTCQSLRVIDLSGSTIYSTTEPCPMCFAAIHWAKIGRIVYGASIADAQRFGFSELTISNQQMKSIGGARIEIVAGVLRAEALELFEAWQREHGKKTY